MAFKKRESISVFEIEEGHIKLALVTVDETGPKLRRLVSINARDKTPSGLSNAVKKLAVEYKLAGNRTIVNIRRYKVTVKNLKLPSTNPTEIESMVALQAAKQLPFPPDKIISSYRILGRDPQGYSDIMMALLHRNFIDMTLSVFNQAGLDVERLALSSEALNLWHSARQKPEGERSCVCLIDLDASSMELHIIRGDSPDFTRAITFSPQDDVARRLLDETRMSFLTFKKAYPGAEITKLVLTGRRSVLDREAPLLKKGLGLPMVFSDSLKQFPKTKDAALPGANELSNESFTALAALGFYADSLQFNFIPSEIKLKKISKILKESLVVTVSLSLCIAIGLGGILLKSFMDKKRHLAVIQKKLLESRPKVEKLTMLKRSTELIRRQTNLKGSSIDVLRELYTNLLPEISLTIFDYHDGESCLLRGSSQKLSDVFKFVSILEDSPYFENVKVRYATKRIIAKQELTDFELVCQLTTTVVEE
ncbi:MAG: pilus assembly protein PilM [Candidatus Omnitrophota bacterium]